MADVSKETIKNLSKLSRIACSEDEQEALLLDLKNILNYFEQLEEINTENTMPCNQVLEDLVNVMREDEPGETLARDVFLDNAPAQIGGMIKVPPVIKQN